MLAGRSGKLVEALSAVASHAPEELKSHQYRRRAQSVSRNPTKLTKREVSLTPKRTTAISQADAVDDYFMQHVSGATTKTSKRTLAKLRTLDGKGLPDPETLESILSKFKPSWVGLIKRRQTEIITSLFPKWLAYLREGFNLLMYGVGSKRELISRFRKDLLAGENCIEVSGYLPTIGMRQILSAILSDILQLSDIPSVVAKQLDIISDFFSRPGASEAPLYLLIHNIDGRNLRTAKAQAILARLAAVPHIHLVASLDNVNLPILWSQTELSRFSWLWEDCSTLAPYAEEASFSNSPLLQQILNGRSYAVDNHLFPNDVDVASLTRLRHVMASLTQNAREIYRLLAEFQLQAIEEAVQHRKITAKGNKSRESEEPAVQGMPLEELYWRCRDAFLVNSEVTLRAQLTEFKDHKLVKFSKSPDGTELLKIPMDKESLKEVLHNKEAFG
ncbi:hypothetical protein AAHC03_01555 [Spirometra sp. Aus1]